MKQLALLSLGLLAGCPPLVNCVANQDCPEGQSCVQGSCQALGGTGAGSSSTGGKGSSTGGTVCPVCGLFQVCVDGQCVNQGSSSGGSAGSSSGGGSSGGGSAGGCPTALTGTSRALATVDSFQGSIWDVTGPPGQPIIGSANLGDIPTAVAVTRDGEILVEMDSNGMVAFDSSGNYLGQIVVPAPSGTGPGGVGLAYLPQPSGPDLVVVCGYEATAFYYGGASTFSNGKVYPTAVWTAEENWGVCFPGPCNTIYAASGPSLQWIDALTGNPHGGGFSGTFVQSQGGVSGGAVAANGDVLVTGDDGSGNGFVALFSSNGACKQARSGGACTLSGCSPCTPGDSTLAATPLYQAAALPDGRFLATVSTGNQTAMNNVFVVDPANGLAVSAWTTATSGTDFYGLVVAPQNL